MWHVCACDNKHPTSCALFSRNFHVKNCPMVKIRAWQTPLYDHINNLEADQQKFLHEVYLKDIQEAYSPT